MNSDTHSSKGCPLAATLSQNFSVLLLGRGGVPFSNANVSSLRNFHIALVDTSPSSASQPFVSTDVVINARARILGGGTCINAGFYTRANSEGWDERLVNDSYSWVEKQIVHRPKLAQWQGAFIDSLLDVGVSPFNGFTYDHIYGTKVGGTLVDHFGRLHSAAELLVSENPKMITVLALPRWEFTFESSSGFGQSQDSIHCHHGIMSAEIGQLSTIPPKQRTPEAIQAFIKRKRDLPHEAFKGGFILEKIARPISIGHLNLVNTNIDDNPSVTFNYFRHPRDLQRCIDGIRMAAKVIQSKYFRLHKFCKDTVITIWHYHGGCHVRKVVNSNFKVLGTNRLRIVVNGSTFSESVNPLELILRALS
ncbi:Protein HOTHEAD [Hibiscus syriacus]|uniref:Protein HOTHEAD n=1 Tax=Hibiscus syriacus TaxID=106335 RepID=A0A6A2WKY4_HIBSY|nr:Protein HOTHEAD [Hibiscus syriacus]